MRYHKEIISVVTLLLALITLTGTAYTDRFPQAAQAESVGFDALAHELFGGAALGQGEQPAKAGAK